MNYRLLGTSTLSISEISFGCMSLDDNDEANKKLLHHAIDHGINYFDTADVYGKGANELTLGKILKDVRYKIILLLKSAINGTATELASIGIPLNLTF